MVQHHPIVGDHSLLWYQNYLTCTICHTWADVFKKLAIKDVHVKAAKAFLWMICALNYSQGYCKFYIGETLELVKDDIFQLMLEKEFLCNYAFELCKTPNYTQLLTEDYEKEKLSSKTARENQNNLLDSLYHVSNLTVGNPTFKILWLSDVELDMLYKEGASSVCKDFRCCHEGDIITTADEAAQKYGNLNCGTSPEGFKKMIQVLNSLNQTNEFNFASILYGGSSSTYDPANILSDQKLNNASKFVYETLRAYNPHNGIYTALGPYDMYFLNYQNFSTASNPKLANIWNSINPADNSGSFGASGYTVATGQFGQYGYYSSKSVVVSTLPDDTKFPQQQSGKLYNQDLTIYVLNSNTCNNRNVGLTKEQADAGGQLQNLETVLKSLAQIGGKKAWIIGHIHPGSKHCNSKWARRYNALIEKY